MGKKKAAAGTASKSNKGDNAAETPQEKSFEQALAEAREIVSRLESGDTPLADALDDYQTGIERLKVCQQILQTAETKVSLLSGFDADGNPVTQPMPELDATTGAGRRTQSTSGKAKKSTVAAENDDLDDSGGLF